MTVRRLVARLPDILAARDLRGAVERIARALRRGRPVVLGMGAHPIKVGLGPVIVDLIERGRLAAVAMNGACLVHDFELAWNGRTSEDVGPGLERGTFGMARETGEFLNRATREGVAAGVGLGRAIGEAILRARLPFRRTSILAAAARAGIPATAHVAIGTDIIHMHPSADGAAIGEGSLRDFHLLAGVVARLAGRATTARVIALTHGIPPHDVLAGALVLRHSVPYFPRGTIHLAVVDPGVGSERRALCVETAGALLVGPDNGLLSLAAPRGEIRRITHLTEEHFFLSPRSATFHGRDVFAPVAAALAAATPVEKLGSEVRDMQRLDLPPVVREAHGLRAQVIYVDHFGNLTTNVSAADLAALAIHLPSIGVGSVRLRGVATSYAAAQRGEPVAVVNSWGLLEIAVREGSARDRLGAGVGAAIVIEA